MLRVKKLGCQSLAQGSGMIHVFEALHVFLTNQHISYPTCILKSSLSSNTSNISLTISELGCKWPRDHPNHSPAPSRRSFGSCSRFHLGHDKALIFLHIKAKVPTWGYGHQGGMAITHVLFPPSLSWKTNLPFLARQTLKRHPDLVHNDFHLGAHGLFSKWTSNNSGEKE